MNEAGTFSQPIDRTAVVPEEVYWLKAFKPQGQPLRFISIHPPTQGAAAESVAITEIVVDLRD
ncbi:MAG TPA: hypothetical protein VIN61_06525 [Gammaproteobacteria bacterium]